MAIQGKKSQDLVSGLSNKLYKGFVDARPVLINPSKSELAEHGKTLYGEPQYVYPERDDKPAVHIMKVYHSWEYKGEKFLHPVDFKITQEEVFSKDKGTYLFTNNKGQFNWGKDLEQIDKRNKNLPDEMRNLRFNLDSKYNPRIAYKGEILLTNYLLALCAPHVVIDNKLGEDTGFMIDVRSYWNEGIIEGNVKGFKEDVFTFDKIRLLVMIDPKNQDMSIFSKESLIGESPFLPEGKNPGNTGRDPFMRFLLDLKKISPGKYSDTPGQWSSSHQYDISFSPELVEREMPDISNFLGKVEEEPTYFAASNDKSEEGFPF